MSAPLNTQLNPVPMHGPIEIQITSYMILPTGHAASLRFLMPSGQIPTRQAIADVVAAMFSPESMAESSIPAGTRPMTKPEFTDYITKRDAGESIPVPGSKEWEPSTVDIPVPVLVHAIMGAALLEDDQGEGYAARDLAFWSELDGGYVFHIEKLSKLPADLLLAIYKEVA